MKKWLSVLLLTAFLAKDGAALGWQLWFWLNQDEIAETLCENKEEPEMHCDGKCYLMKQLRKLEEPAQEQQKHTPVNPLQKLAKLECCQLPDQWSWPVSLLTATSKTQIQAVPERFYQEPLLRTWQPPKV